MSSQRFWSLAAALVLWGTPTLAQPPTTGIYARDGWEAFAGVYYEGGDATQPKRLMGMLVLTDSSIGLHPCVYEQCQDDKKGKQPFKEPAYFTIPLNAVKRITNSSQVRDADLAGKIMVGGLAPARAEDFVAIVYESPSSVEAPLFKSAKTQVAAIDAKLRFRLKKRGIELQDK
jgi:hypothetical protein